MFENINSADLKYVGQSVGRKDTQEKITGSAIYTSDMSLPGMLYAQIKKSPHASAKIKKISIAKAKKLPGVRAILTGNDLDYKIGLYIVDKHILAKDVVRHYGEAIAAVAADTIAIAKQAIDLIDVEYEIQTPILSPIDSISENAPLIHPELNSYDYIKEVFSPQLKTNIANISKCHKGDIQTGFKNSKWIIERKYTNPSVQHVPMETHGVIAKWNINNYVTIWTSAQSPFTVRELFCKTFALPLTNVRVIIPHVGGGFGGKAGIHLEPLIACLSRQAKGLPVKFQASREDEFSLLPCRSALVYNIKTGIDINGKILAQKMDMFWDAGAYADYAVNVTRASGYSAAGPYEIPNAEVNSYTIYTNKTYGTAYRGFGHVEFFWGLERHMELVAKTIGVDPLIFRQNNLLKPGSITLTGEKITEHSGNIDKCLKSVAKSINYGKLTEQEKLRERQTGVKIGKGLATLHKAPAMPPFTTTAAIIKMNSDSSILINIGLTEIGQGSTTALAQIAAECLKFPLSKISITIEKDTDYDPYDWQTVASKGLILTGNAIILACKNLLKQAYTTAGQILHAQTCDLSHNDQHIFLKHNPTQYISFSQLAIGYHYPNGNSISGPLIGVGYYSAQGLTNLDKETGHGLPAIDWTYGAHGIIVELDPITGIYKILKIASAYDVGKAINPELVRGQCIGGMIQGLGTAMCEGYIYNKNGILLNPTFTDNKILTAKDIPQEIENIILETPQLDGPFGARGIGEHSMISVAPALGNAIQNAIGADITHMPISFEDVWLAIQNKDTAKRYILKSPVE